MPGRLRQPNKAAALPLEIAQSGEAYSIPHLNFSDAITWKAGKAIPVAELLSRLSTLSNGLRTYEEDQTDQQSFVKLGIDLANANLLGHKDRGVRALSMVCIVELLRICAPNAPFKSGHLKDIFTVFISTILPAIADPSHAYNKQHVYILQSLTEYKSICLITDVDNVDGLIIPLFSACFDIVSGSAKGSGDVQLGKTVEFNLNSMLSIVIDEVNTLPQDVTDIIISQFLRIDPRSGQTKSAKNKKNDGVNDDKQDTLLLKEYPPAYNMAKTICTSCSEKMTTQISVYFSNVIVDAAATKSMNVASKHAGRRLSELDVEDDDDEEDLADLSKAHRLIRELWRACPDVLLNVIPQIEAELSAEAVPIRLLATQTLGDIAAGVGIAGAPPSNVMDPAAYPLPTIDSDEPDFTPSNRLLLPMSPKPFIAVHSAAFQSFLTRRHDRSPAVRATWATAVGRILLTSAGGIGLSDEDQGKLLSGLSQSLEDNDERVRAAAVNVIGTFGYKGVINCLGLSGSISADKSSTEKPSAAKSVFNALANRVKDRKHTVREEAFKVLSRMWGVASRDIESNNETVVKLLGDAPSRILEAYYTNEPDIHALLDEVMMELLLPLSFPPVKGQFDIDPDAIRAKRMLTFVRSLNARARPVFFAMQARQVQLVKAISIYLKACEDYNGGVVEENEDEIKAQLSRIIDLLTKNFPEPAKASADLWKFAKMHDRRNYQLIRFCLGPSYDYRTVTKAVKELTKRIQSGLTSTQSLLETITPLLYRCSLVIFNRSHVPTIMNISRSDENGLADTAHEVLKQISTRNPEVLKTHIQDMCKDLETHAPSASKPEDPSAADSLKACAAFALKFPAEVSKDRKFLIAMSNFALFGSPRGAKHAVSILMAVADKKEMYAKEILQKSLKGWTYGGPHFLARLSAIAQICLLAPATASSETEAILEISMVDVLPRNRSTSADSDSLVWEVVPSEETIAKELALKIMVNRCRSEDEKSNREEFDDLVNGVYKILMNFIREDSEMGPSQETPASQRNRLRLIAIKYILKLCSSKRRCDDLLTPTMFNEISWTCSKPPHEVRVGFIGQLKKYLGQGRLNHRWFTVFFLLAFEADEELRTSTVTWLKSRVHFFAKQQQQARTQDKKGHENVMEMIMARFLSLLVHHPDCPEPGSEGFNADVLDFAQYPVFYLQAVANDENISLIFHVAQRVKQARDAIDGTDETSKKLYVLSDLTQATIRHYADLMPAHAKGINLLQTWPGKIGLPMALYGPLKGHDAAVRIAETNHVPEEVEDYLERKVRDLVKGKKHQGSKKVVDKSRKRKSDSVEDGEDDDDAVTKPVKKNKRSVTLPVRKASKEAQKTPRHKRKSSSEVPSSEMPSRKSMRVSTATGVSYVEGDSEEEDDKQTMADYQTPAPRAKSATKIRTKTTTIEEDQEPSEEEEETVDEIMTNGENGKENEKKKKSDIYDMDEMDEEVRKTSASPLKEKGNNSSAKKSWADIGLNGKGAASGKKEKKAAPAKKTAAKGKANTSVPATARPTRSSKA